MASRALFRLVCFLAFIFGEYEVAASDCEFVMEYVAFPNQFKYYSSCNEDEYLIITMSTLIEYTFLGIPTTNVIVFGQNGFPENWNWMSEFGELWTYQGYECLINKYVGKLGGIFGNNCLFNLTTYLFDEIANIDIYNLTKQIMNKYTLKWDVDIEEWPWLLSSDYIELCMLIQTNVGGVVNTSSDEYFLNFTFGADFYVSIPKLMTCNGQIDGNVEIEINDNYLQNLVSVCIKMPYCEGEIFYDPIIYSDYDGNTSGDDGLTSGQIAGIVIGVLIGVIAIVLCGLFCYKKKKEANYASLLK